MAPGSGSGAGPGWRPLPATDGTGGHGRAGPAAPAFWLGRAAQRSLPEALSASQASVVAGGGLGAGRGTAGPARAGPAPPGVRPGTAGRPGLPRAGLGLCPGLSRGRRDQRPSAVAGGARLLGRPAPSTSRRGIFCLTCDSGRRSAFSAFLAASRGDFLS